MLLLTDLAKYLEWTTKWPLCLHEDKYEAMHIIHSRDESVIICTSGDPMKNVNNSKISVSRYERISQDNYFNMTVDSDVIKHSVC